MPSGAVPGERRGGRQKGTPNKATAKKKADLQEALKLAFAALGPDGIDELSPAELLRFASREAAKAGFIQAAASLAKDAAPYFNARPSAAPLPGDETVQRQSYIVAPEQAESMEAWTQEAKTILAEKSGAPNPDLKPSC